METEGNGELLTYGGSAGPESFPSSASLAIHFLGSRQSCSIFLFRKAVLLCPPGLQKNTRVRVLTWKTLEHTFHFHSLWGFESHSTERKKSQWCWDCGGTAGRGWRCRRRTDLSYWGYSVCGRGWGGEGANPKGIMTRSALSLLSVLGNSQSS